MYGPVGQLDCAERPSAYAIGDLEKAFPAFADWYDALDVKDKNEVARLIDNAVVESIRTAMHEEPYTYADSSKRRSRRTKGDPAT